MNTKLLLIAASTLAIAACGGTDVEDDRIETADAEIGAETLVEPDQPPLEGDSPFVDARDVADSRLDQENYDTGFDGTDLTDSELTDAEPDFDDAYASGDLDGNDELFDDESAEIGAIGTGLAAAGTGMANDAMDAGRAAMNDGMDRMETAANDVASTVTDGVAAKQYTAENTDAYVADGGELITGSEAALLAGTYDVELPESIKPTDGYPTLYIDGRGDQAVGTFAGEPIEVAVTGRNFQFDAPVMMNGAEEIMTFTGTFENGEIDNGVLEAQGDGSTMTFTAVRTDAEEVVGTDDMRDDFEADDGDDIADDMMDDATDPNVNY